MTNGAKLTRVLLKLSGEVLSGGPAGKSIEPETLAAISEELAEVHASGCQIGIVIGGGNIFRGLKGSATGNGPHRGRPHGYVGYRREWHRAPGRAREGGVDTRVMSALEIKAVCEPYIRRRAVRHLEKAGW